LAKRTREQTRQLLLDVGIELLYERGIHLGVTHIRLSDVVAAAGLTTGAAYRCWENQDAFYRDLAAAAILHREKDPVDDTIDRIAPLLAEGAPLAEVVRTGAEANLHRYPEDTAYLTKVALRVCGPTDGSMTEATQRRFKTSLDSYSGMYAELLAVFGRRMRTPYTLRDLALSLMALSEGFTIQAMGGAEHPHVERTDLDPRVGTDWTLFACAVEGVIEHFTERDPDADHEWARVNAGPGGYR
jgi:AcrR family transcriptional regulator